ncbi:transcriptional regulator, AraC family [Bradyrhizobium sp. Rc2d]|uniref:AraC family transcriptional regulator n=1 Tax=Bradyrhizobium sp. Rc2d TaxID=1855321 RepID=UPI000880C055|nr:AraC family transcriptional regulator [Bradyrhizobium sp. Rc2d]SDH33625.1 transcriptional regulator, AraC family [Bradyrhizobium sp. Rc2d]
MIYARSARKSSRSDQALDKPSDRHKTLDPLSQVFSLLNVRAARCTRFEAGGNWSYRFPAKPALKFGAVIRGDCWIDFGDEAHHRLVSGDCFLLANAPAYVLANDQRLAPEDGIAAFDWTQSDVARHAGRDTVLLAGSFGFEASDAGLLLDALPRFLLIPSRSPSAAVIHSTLEILDLEIRGTGIGAAVLTDRLADVLLVQVLRAALDQDSGEGLGWINALVDARIGKAIRLIHEDAAHPWTLEALSEAIAMSRSAFSKRFKSLVGLAPLDYLLRWRMRLARDLLRRGATVSATAAQLGYSSESAFGHAFKRVYGHAPKRYWRRQAIAEKFPLNPNKLS